jgi:uncharacterized protein
MRTMATNLETVQRWYAERDTTLLADDILWRVLETFPEGGEYRGREAVVERFFPAVLARFDSYGARPERFLKDGDTVVALGRYEARGLSGRAASAAFAHVWTVHDGRIASFEQVADTAALAPALSA